ncbi:MAG: hypothetical protein ACLTAZ_07465 [Dysosmobacter welbionis]|uniref:hypothetical protein n=1 Tax=Dysosmobacter welbionis TaxID=2093857 RepID=UPI0039961440
MKPTCITCKADCHNAGTTSRIVDCSQYKPGRILTNADRIRAMSDEELAHLLCFEGWQMSEVQECLEWLQQPAEEDT